jgi:hypothetical protein
MAHTVLIAVSLVVILVIIFITIYNVLSQPYNLPIYLDKIDRLCKQQEMKKCENIIWTYWNTCDPSIDSKRCNKSDALNGIPIFIQKCMKNWKNFNPEYTIILITPDNLSEYINPADLPGNFYQLITQKQADWIRLYVIMKYGGTWLDSSIILTSPLRKWMNTIKKDYNSNGLLFYMKCQSIDTFQVENWFINSSPMDPFIVAWFKEFDRVCRVYSNNGSGYLDELQRLYPNEYPIMIKNKTELEYLTAYVVTQKIILIDHILPFHLEPADTYGYYFQTRYNFHNMNPFIFKDSSINPVPPIIKLIGSERRNAIEYIENGGNIHDNSIYSLYLQ